MTERTAPKAPVLIELGHATDGMADPDPGSAPALPDASLALPATGFGRALARRSRGSGAGRWVLGLGLALAGFLGSVALWTSVEALLARAPVLGSVALALTLAFAVAALILALREGAAYLRLLRLDRIRTAAEAAVAAGDLGAARTAADALATLYGARPDLAWAAARYQTQRSDALDSESALAFAEQTFLEPLDTAARREIEAAARQVATITAIVPLALADVAAALWANLRLIRRMAEIYGGRAGTLGSWRLLRQVAVHLVATGAVAVGDDLVQSLVGGGLLSRLSRRFGEGVVNGALTARVGVAAMEACRPLPFRALPRPKVTNLVSRALKGLFTTDRAAGAEPADRP